MSRLGRFELIEGSACSPVPAFSAAPQRRACSRISGAANSKRKAAATRKRRPGRPARPSCDGNAGSVVVASSRARTSALPRLQTRSLEQTNRATRRAGLAKQLLGPRSQRASGLRRPRARLLRTRRPKRQFEIKPDGREAGDARHGQPRSPASLVDGARSSRRARNRGGKAWFDSWGCQSILGHARGEERERRGVTNEGRRGRERERERRRRR